MAYGAAAQLKASAKSTDTRSEAEMGGQVTKWNGRRRRLQRQSRPLSSLIGKRVRVVSRGVEGPAELEGTLERTVGTFLVVRLRESLIDAVDIRDVTAIEELGRT